MAATFESAKPHADRQLGSCSGASSQTVNLNEVTTAAAPFAMSQFFITTLGAYSTNAFGGEADPATTAASSTPTPRACDIWVHAPANKLLVR